MREIPPPNYLRQKAGGQGRTGDHYLGDDRMDKSFLKTAVKLAEKAGEIQLKGFGREHNLEYKIGSDIVTEVDKACEKLIVSGLMKNFPSHDILAEEGTGPRKTSPWRWIVDPLDGTSNFAHTYPHFAVSLALEYEGEVILGVVFDPNRNEMFTAEKGAGAFLNNRRIKVSSTDTLKKALLDTGFAYNESEEEKELNIKHFINFLREAHAIRRDGAATLDFCYVACGRFDGFWELFLKPWDVAAGSIIVKEAGGEVSLFNGALFDIYKMEVLASNGKIHNDMMQILKMNI